MFLNKRGQMTLFIIAGVVILFVAFFFGYLQNESLRQRVESELFGAAVVPEQAKGVVSYLDGCVERIAKDGLMILGSKGGYIKIPEQIGDNPKRVLEFDQNTKIPYWIYGDQKQIPTVEEMEQQLDTYINSRLGECDLSEFNIPKTSELKIISSINDKSVIFKLVSGLDVLIKDKTFDLSDYVFVEIKTEFKNMFDLGKSIVSEELKTSALEYNTINLISTYGLGNKEEIPPISGMDFDCGQKIWIKPEVKRILREILTSNIIYLKVIGSGNYNVKSEFYDSMTWNLESGAENLNINFLYYPEWPLFLDVYPSDGAVIRGNRIVNAFPILFLCMNFYNFRYDMNYPVVVDITDEFGYRFRFPIEVVIKDNFGRKRVFDTEFLDEKQSLFCDLDQRLSKDITVITVDKNNERLGDVDVIYSCGGESCTIGKTDDTGELIAKFPLCYGGRLDLIKEDYLGVKQKLNVDENTQVSVGGVLHKFENKKVGVSVFDIKENKKREMRDDEKVILQFNRFNAEINDYDHYTALVLNGTAKEEIKLVPGLYHVEMSLLSSKEITIPSKTLNLGPLGILGRKTLPEIKFDTMVEGGAKFEWFIDDMNFNEIELTVLSWGLPRSYDDLNNDYNVDELSLEHNTKLNLEFR